MDRSTRMSVCVAALLVAVGLASMALRGGTGASRPFRTDLDGPRATGDAIGRHESTPAHARAAANGLAMPARWPDRLALARQLRACAELRELTPAAIARRQDDLADGWRLTAAQIGRAVDEDALRAQTAEAVARRVAEKAACARFPDAAVTHYLRWLEAAAIGGSDDAKREYAQAVIHESQDADTLFRNIDEFARRKRVAFALLEQVLPHDCTASTQLELFAPDPATAYAYALVTFDWGRAIQPSIASPELAAQNIAFMQGKLDEQAVALTPVQRSRARARADAAYAACR